MSATRAVLSLDSRLRGNDVAIEWLAESIGCLLSVEIYREHVMTFEFGAGSFGLVIGFVAWRVFCASDTYLDVKQLVAFIGALSGAGVLAVFPTGTNLFASYSVGLALGFFLIPAFSRVSKVAFLKTEATQGDGDGFANQIKYLDEYWPEVERVIECALIRQKGTISQRHLFALPFDESGRRAALKRFARTYPERSEVWDGYWRFKLRADNLSNWDQSKKSNSILNAGGTK